MDFSDPLLFFTADDLARGAARARVSQLSGWVEIVLDLLLLLALSTGALGHRLHRLFARLPDREGPLRRVLGAHWLQTTAFFASLALLRQLVSLPAVLWRRSLALELGLSHEGWLSWWGRFGLESLTLVAAFALLGPVLGAVRQRWPRRWWLLIGLAGALALVGDTLLEPYRARVTFKETPLVAGELRERLEALAEAHGGAGEITVLDASRLGTHANAFTTGMGPTRRIVLTDTLLKMGDDAVLGAVAHELGHRRAERLPFRLLLSALGLLVLLALIEASLRWASRRGAHSLGQSFAFVLVVLTTVNFVLLPIRAAFSRTEEREADTLELATRRDYDAYIRDQVALVRANVLEPHPSLLSRLFSSHPSPMERIVRAHRLREEQAREPVLETER